MELDLHGRISASLTEGHVTSSLESCTPDPSVEGLFYKVYKVRIWSHGEHFCVLFLFILSRGQNQF